MPDGTSYKTILVNAWSRDKLGLEIEQALSPYRPEQIVAIEVEANFWHLGRYWAVIVVAT
jgi:hypothetical protein